jgi:hypothetical protein
VESEDVIEDNYPKFASEAVELRKDTIGAGQLMGGLIRSTESRKSKMAGFLSSLFALLSAFFLHQ